MTITEMTTIADIARALPASVRVFQRHDIDFCCGGKLPLGVVCREHGLDFVHIAHAIEAASAVSSGEVCDWSRKPLRVLIGHIVVTYHRPLREELPRLQAMASKVAQVHGNKGPQLRRLDEAVAELSTDLLAHMRKEEAVLFPAIEALEAGKIRTPVPLAVPISVMEQEHEYAGALLTELRSLTNGYDVPEWGCATVRALYHGLAELESSMHVHVHLENNVLFPRTLRLLEGERQRLNFSRLSAGSRR
jgi:regulator of cell morphogenesis and NO signaling